MSNKCICKVVFLVVGLGIWFLLVIKIVFKEMLLIIDWLLIQYVVDEVIEVGCDILIFIINCYKYVVVDYFDKVYELEQKFECVGKKEQLELVWYVLLNGVWVIFVIQVEVLGLGYVVFCVKVIVGDELFVVLLFDDLIWNCGDGVFKQMVDVNQVSGVSIIVVEDVLYDKIGSYGIVVIDVFDGCQGWISVIVEKFKFEDVLSDFVVVGCYVLSLVIFDLFEFIGIGVGGEIQLIDVIVELFKIEWVDVYWFEGICFDCGIYLGLVEVIICFVFNNEKLVGFVCEMFKKVFVDS